VKAVMNDVTVRPAGVPDLPVLAAMRWQFRTDGTEPSEDRTAFEKRFCERVSASFDDGSWRAWVATDDGEVIGHIYASRIGKLPNPVDEAETHLYLSNLYVRPEYRGRGIAAALLDAALADLDDIDATILWARPGTAALYARYGFGESPEILERRPLTATTDE
jgi:GNAT superfamily N-acetyltransferase